MALDLATLQARAADVDEALHQLRMGKAVVEVWRDGRRLSFARADLNDLKDYSAELASQITALQNGTDPAAPLRRGSMRPVFGNRDGYCGLRRW